MNDGFLDIDRPSCFFDDINDALGRLRFFNSQLSFVEDKTTVNNFASKRKGSGYSETFLFSSPFLETFSEEQNLKR